jgi:hypothetical protein
MGADEDAAGADDDRRSQKDRADDPVEEEDRERDSEGGACVVARERWIVRAGSPHVC